MQTVLIPVTVTLLVPVGVDVEGEGATSIGMLDKDTSVVNAIEHPEILTATVNAVNEPVNKERIADALEHLLSGLYLYKKKYPLTKGRFSPFFGFSEEFEVE